MGSPTAKLIEAVRVVGSGVWAALLPAPERDGFARRHAVDPAAYSLLLGVAQFVAGALLFVFGGLGFLQSTVGDQAATLLGNWFPGLSTLHVRGIGLVNAIAWLLHPLAWVYGALALTGAVRCAAFVAAQQAVGEPLVWAALRIRQAVGGRLRRAARLRELGPLRPDRLLHSPSGELTIVSSRDRPLWSDSITLQVGEEFYRLTGARCGVDGAHHAMYYLFRPLRGNELIRGLLRYEPLELP